MNEQKKELMLKAAVQFKGVWPDGYEALVVSTETNSCWGAGTYQDFADGEALFNRVMGDANDWLWVCTKQEFEAFIDSLFDGAPDGTTHLDVNDSSRSKWIQFDGVKWFYSCEGAWEIWDFRRKNEELIPRQRKQIKGLGNVTGTNVGEWDGEGLPPVGVECLFDCTAREKWWVNGIGTVKYISDYTCIMDVGDSEFVAHPDTMKFRPLKTESEKEREAMIELALSLDCDPQEGMLSRRDFVGAMLDAGWRPSKDQVR